MKIDKYYHLIGRKDDVVIEDIGWTPTASRLPDPGRYLVTVKRYGRRDKNKYTTTTSVSNYYNGTWSGYDAEDVLAWMPMPEPAEDDK